MIDRRLDYIRAQMRNNREPLEHQLVESEQKYAASCRDSMKQKENKMDDVHHILVQVHGAY